MGIRSGGLPVPVMLVNNVLPKEALLLELGWETGFHIPALLTKPPYSISL
jgi:hypothetical protein